MILGGGIGPLLAQEQDSPRDAALALLDELERGGAANRGDLESLVEAVRHNPEIPARDRFVVVSRARDLAIRETKGLTRVQRLAAYEQSARDMIAEFPAEPEPYAALLALANDQPAAAEAERLAREILTMNAPEEIKAGARVMLDRLALVGQPLDLAYDDGQGLPFNLARLRGKVVVLYAWSGQGRDSHRWVRSLLAKGIAGVEFVGLNFDPDRALAIGRAAEVALGSRQLYDPSGLHGELARRLHIGRVPVIYLIDRDGIVRETWVWADYPAALARLVGEGGRS